MRVKIPKHELQKFLTSSGGAARIAEQIGLHPRTIRDWGRGKYTPKLELLRDIARINRIALPKFTKLLPDYWYARKAGKMGGKKVMEKYGAFPSCTPKARKVATLKAMQTRIKRGDLFYAPKEVAIPLKSPALAEFIGILLGDGGVSKRQVTITLHKIDDARFALHVARLIKQLFDIIPSIKERSSVVNLTISRTTLVGWLRNQGLPIGSKVRAQADIPQWIKNKPAFVIACLRGLFDTDGCFYIDTHRYKNKIYKNCALNFTNRSMPILKFFKTSLEDLGLHPTQKTKYSVFLRREDEIKAYFRKIGSSNPKHKNKFTSYLTTRYGGVPKWS